MSVPPHQPKIYHIVHVDRLASIIADSQLLSDEAIAQRADGGTVIGMSKLKAARLVLPVKCHAGLRVGQFVPFYFCARSVMLYVIHMANHPELTYKGGQRSIIHLEADLHTAIAWANEAGRPWAFSLSNAASAYATFKCTVEDLDQVNWQAVSATDFRPSEIKEGKQAEFLTRESFPWTLIERIGVQSQELAQRVSTTLVGALHRPPVQVRHDWYY